MRISTVLLVAVMAGGCAPRSPTPTFAPPDGGAATIVIPVSFSLAHAKH